MAAPTPDPAPKASTNPPKPDPAPLKPPARLPRPDPAPSLSRSQLVRARRQDVYRALRRRAMGRGGAATDQRIASSGLSPSQINVHVHLPSPDAFRKVSKG